jgi:hypothetical protein
MPFFLNNAVLLHKRRSRVINPVHRQEIMKLLVFPIMKHIDITDFEDILRDIRFTPEDMPKEVYQLMDFFPQAL